MLLQSVPLAAALYDDVILREATRRGLPVIDLRAVCDRPELYDISQDPGETENLVDELPVLAGYLRQSLRRNRKPNVLFFQPEVSTRDRGRRQI